MTASGRIHSLDVLRGIAMLLGVVLHATIAYKEGYHYGEWAFDLENQFWFFDWLYLWINSFRMQLFFLLAGFFSRLLLLKIGLVPFALNRFRRVALPLILSYFTILPLTLIAYLYATQPDSTGKWEGIMAFIKDFYLLKAHSGFMHLWFLQHLVLFYVVTTGLVWLIGLERLNGKAILSGLKPTIPAGLTVILICSLIIAVISQLFPAPLPSIWTGFKIPVSQLIYYAAFFVFGWVLERNRNVFDSLSKVYKSSFFVGSILSFIILFCLNNWVRYQDVYSLGGAVLKIVFAFQTVLLIVAVIGFFNDRFKAKSEFWSYLADSSYWVYLIHLPIVLGMQQILIGSPVPGIMRFPVVLLVSLGISYLSYHFLVRYTLIGTLLNGKRNKPGHSAIQPVSR